MPLILVMAVPPGSAQTQVTFYSAFEDGLDAERQGHWKVALLAFQRASELRPQPAAGVFTYGNNRLPNYYPYGHVARCAVELGDWSTAAAYLKTSEAKGEPAALREPVARRVKDAETKLNDARPSETRAGEMKPAVTKGTDVEPKILPVVTPPDISMPETSQRESAVLLPGVVFNSQHNPKQPDAGALTPPVVSKPSSQASSSVSSSTPLSPTPVKSQEMVSPKPLPNYLWALLPVLLMGVAGGFLLRRRRKGSGPDDTQPFQIHPTVLGPYAIERLLGRGGFANTYLAHHQKTGDAVAVKVLHTHRWDDVEMLKRFRQEAKVGAMLKHPNIVPILDASPGGESTSEPPWIAMAYVEGETLEAHLKSSGALPISECVNIALDLAKALAHAHTFGVVHRDLKPANVMLNRGCVMVMDLGIARVLDSATVTSTYAFLGTPLYAAPEAQKRTHVGPAADRYALGIMLFEMLTGVLPFTGETPFEVLDRHRAHPLPELRFLRKDAPPALVRLVERLTQKDPDLRPEDLEVVKILQELMQD